MIAIPRTKNAYQEFVTSKIRTLKSKAFGVVLINGRYKDTSYTLVCLTASCGRDKRIISLLSKWREKHEAWFAAQFPVTNKRTGMWFKNLLIDKPDRLLFMIRISDRYIGHIGLNRFNFETRTCEIDNIVRGETGYPGLMEKAIVLLMGWGQKHLGVRGYGLSTFSDNERALNLYHRLGFVQLSHEPLVYRKTKEGGEWVDAPEGNTEPIARYNVHMKQLSKKIKPSKHKISFAGPSMTAREIRYVVDAVKHGWYQTFDKDIKKLEETMANYVGTKYALAGFCATHALHLACIVCGFKKGDEVIVTDFSWVATAHVIAYTGATPVFVDIDPDTWCISPEAIEKAITKKTKGIMLVHTFGMPANMDAIMRIASKYKLKVIEDAAPSLGSLYKGRKVGGFGDVGCISFHGAKIAASGEGGMFLTNNKEMYEKAIYYSNMGRTDRLANFWCDSMGYEYQMANVTAALARAQVERIEELVARKRKIFNWYWKRLGSASELKLLKEKEGLRCNYAYPAVLLKTNVIGRNELIARLKDYNIHGREAFPRMSRFPMYTARYKNPVAAEAEKYGFNLPSALDMKEKDVDFVCKILLTLIRNTS